MDLIYFEIQKLFLNKRTLPLILVCLLICMFSGVMAIVNLKNNSGDLKKLAQLIQEYEGPVDPQLAKKAEDEVDRLQTLRTTNPEAFSKEDKSYVAFQYLYANAMHMTKNYQEGSERENPENPYSIIKMTNYLERHSNNKNSYEYKKIQNNLQMKLDAGEPKSYNVVIWSEIFSFLGGGGGFFLLALLAIVVAPIFSGETASGMDSIILSSKLGRRKIVTAKIISVVAFSTIWVLCFYTLYLGIFFVLSGGLIGFDKPLNSLYLFHISPYGGLSIVSYMLISIGYAWLACLTLSIITSFISTTQQTSLPTFGIVLAILFIPQLLDTANIRYALWPLIDFGFTRIANGVPIFSSYKSYNILGNPLLYPIAIVIVLGVLLTLMIYLTYASYKRKNAT